MCPEFEIGNLIISSVKVFHTIGALGLLIYCLITRKKYNITKLMAVIYSVVLVGAGLVEFQIMGKIQDILINIASGGEIVLGNSRRIIGVLFFQPIFIYLLSLITGDKFRKIADFIAPGTFICFVFGKIACFTQGCCHGYPDPNGFFTDNLGEKAFPVQLYESATTILVVVVLTILLSKRIKIRRGSLFPIGSILYSIIRFYWENYRYYDNQWEKDYFLGMNFWQVCCVLVIIISVIWLIVLYSAPKYAKCSMEKNEKALLPVMKKKIDTYAEEKKERNKVHHTAKDKKRNKNKK